MTKSLKFITVLTMLIIIFAAIKALDNVIIPIILSLFITIILNPFIFYLEKLNIPRVLAICVLLMALFITTFLLIIYLGMTINELVKTLPLYRTYLVESLQNISLLMRDFGINISNDEIIKYIDPTNIISLLTKMVGQLSNAITWIVLIFIIVAFMLLESKLFFEKFKSIMPYAENGDDIISKIIKKITAYLVLKAGTSLLTGLSVWGVLVLFDVSFAFIWGMLAFLLNFIPNIGSILAAIPPILQTLVFNGTDDAFILMLSYIAINLLLGNILEPKLLGNRLGLSTLIVFLSILFWGWLLGTIGMFLSVPLTIVTKIILEQFKGTQNIAMLLSDSSNRHRQSDE